MIIKYNKTTKPAFIVAAERIYGTDFFVTDGLKYFGAPGKTLDDGDFIIVLGDGIYSFIKATDYATNNEVRQQVKEEIGREALREIWKAFQASGLSDAVKTAILQMISVVLTACLAGEVVAARNIASAISTDVNYTNGRKNALLNILDAQIDKL